MSCPACGNLVPREPVVDAVGICPSCLASVVLTGEAVRRATAEDTVGLTESQLAKLRTVRKRYRETAR